MVMETFFHGTTKLFKKFDTSHALEGDGKCKFGFGSYITEIYATAAHYAYNEMRPCNKDYYVYTVEIPDLTEDNHLVSAMPVCRSIIERTEYALGEAIPQEVSTKGKEFRKYVGNRLIGKKGTVRQLREKADLAAEKAATKFFSEKIGIEYYVWPQSQVKPDGPTNRVVLDVNKMRIIKIDKVELTTKDHQLVKGSEKEVPSDSF